MRSSSRVGLLWIGPKARWEGLRQRLSLDQFANIRDRVFSSIVKRLQKPTQGRATGYNTMSVSRAVDLEAEECWRGAAAGRAQVTAIGPFLKILGEKISESDRFVVIPTV